MLVVCKLKYSFFDITVLLHGAEYGHQRHRETSGFHMLSRFAPSLIQV